MSDPEQEGLRAAIESLHSCKASFYASQICQAGDEGPEFTRDVATFALHGHPTAPLAYAWSDVREHTIKHRVVLHTAGVTSASDALKGFLLFAWEDPPGN